MMDGEKLAKDAGEVGWSYLKPHYKNGVLFFVDGEIGLTDAGEAIAEDRREVVEKWLTERLLVKIGALHAAQWEGGDEVFRALVVSPFVLFQVV